MKDKIYIFGRERKTKERKRARDKEKEKERKRNGRHERKINVTKLNRTRVKCKIFHLFLQHTLHFNEEHLKLLHFRP